ncbi:MAG TPA: type VI secretion system contractile sheath large subunit, partial [Holosporales bacterium]|nr:type VI secretion system contractile sheath large subunit [Holosporales bacterium]
MAEEKNGTLVDKLLYKAKLIRDESQKTFACDLLAEFARQVEQQGNASGMHVGPFLSQRIAQMDEIISDQLNEVLHHKDFQKLEGSWRGLSHLVGKTMTGTSLKLRLLNITKDELKKDLEKAVEFDQSQLFKKVYEEEYGTFGGNPYSALVADFYFGRNPIDVEILDKLSNVAAAAHAPVITAAHPKMFDVESYEDLGVPRDLSKLFESLELVKWNSFRGSEDSRYVTL